LEGGENAVQQADHIDNIAQSGEDLSQLFVPREEEREEFEVAALGIAGDEATPKPRRRRPGPVVTPLNRRRANCKVSAANVKTLTTALTRENLAVRNTPVTQKAEKTIVERKRRETSSAEK
jgi:hypothetical protein